MKSKLKPNSPPVHVAIPSTSVEKMQAIVKLSEAIEHLARALNSTNVSVLVKDCHIVSTTTGMVIGGQE